MFEHITIRRSTPIDSDKFIDIGLLLESMLFYKKTTVIIDRAAILKQLIKAFGFDHLYELMNREILSVVYSETMTAIITNTDQNGFSAHDPIIISSPQHTFQIEIQRACIEIAEKEGKGRRNSNRLSKKITVSNHEGSLTEDARRLFGDEDFMSLAVPALLKNWIPDLPNIPNILFRPERTERGFAVSTNLDFLALNRIYHRRTPKSHSSISPASILASLYEVETDLYYASRNLSEISSSRSDSRLIDLRLTHLANRCSSGRKQKDSFQSFVFSSQATVREAYNAGRIDLKSIIKAIYRAEDFKNWLVTQTIDKDLLTEYTKAISTKSPIEKLPSKIARWSLFTGTGFLSDLALTGGVGTVAGLGLSVLDSFLVDKIVGGWKPNQFVDGHLRDLIEE